MTFKRKFMKINTCTIGVDGKPVDIKTELIMLSEIGKIIESQKGISRIFNMKGDFVCNTTLTIEQILEEAKNPIELII